MQPMEGVTAEIVREDSQAEGEGAVRGELVLKNCNSLALGYLTEAGLIPLNREAYHSSGIFV